MGLRDVEEDEEEEEEEEEEDLVVVEVGGGDGPVVCTLEAVEAEAEEMLAAMGVERRGNGVWNSR